MRVIRSLVIAFSTYSRIPMPQVEWTEENRRYSMCFFPLVGLVTAALLWGWLALCDRWGLPPLIRGAAAALLPLAVTGGIHMDGFMDTCDALASMQSPQKRLEILKDSRVGAFAVMHCAGYLLVTCALYSAAAAPDGPLLGCAFVLSRALSAWTLTAFRSARPGGMLDAFRASQKRLTLLCAACYGLLCFAVWALYGGLTALLCAAAAAACLAAYRRMAYRCFGGVTGDLAGWFLQVTEAALTAAVILGRRIL